MPLSIAVDRHEHIHAGHLLRLGNLPTDAQWTGGLLLGGTREGQAAAQRDGTARVLNFLRERVGASRGRARIG